MFRPHTPTTDSKPVDGASRKCSRDVTPTFDAKEPSPKKQKTHDLTKLLKDKKGYHYSAPIGRGRAMLNYCKDKYASAPWGTGVDNIKFKLDDDASKVYLFPFKSKVAKSDYNFEDNIAAWKKFVGIDDKNETVVEQETASVGAGSGSGSSSSSPSSMAEYKPVAQQSLEISNQQLLTTALTLILTELQRLQSGPQTPEAQQLQIELKAQLQTPLMQQHQAQLLAQQQLQAVQLLIAQQLLQAQQQQQAQQLAQQLLQALQQQQQQAQQQQAQQEQQAFRQLQSSQMEADLIEHLPERLRAAQRFFQAPQQAPASSQVGTELATPLQNPIPSPDNIATNRELGFEEEDQTSLEASSPATTGSDDSDDIFGQTLGLSSRSPVMF